MSSEKLITILGPTATGKTQLASHLALIIQGEIISADSRQVYRNMTIGTGKDLEDYKINDIQIPFHLIDIAEPGEEYNLFRFVSDAKNKIREINGRSHVSIICGGTGMYIEALLRKFDVPDVPPDNTFRESLEEKSDEELTSMLQSFKSLHNHTDTENRRRLIRAVEIAHFSATKGKELHDLFPEKQFVFGIQLPREEVRRRITERLHARLEQGMIAEVEALLSSGVAAERLIRYGLEYKFITEYIIGKTSYNDMVRLLNIAIHQFSKRQMTWFRGMERRGVAIQWIDGTLPMQKKLDFILDEINAT